MNDYEKILLIVGIVILVFFVICLTLAIITYFVVFKRMKTPSIYEMSEKLFMYKYKEELIKGHKWYESLPKDIYIITNDRGIELIGKHTINPNNKNKNVILYSHGYRSEGCYDITCMGSSMLYDQGYDIFVIDQEAHGASSGKYTTFGLRDSDNILLWVDKINEIYQNDCNIILFGDSMGANTVMLTADKPMKNVKMIIADCGFSSAYDELKYSIIKKYKLGIIVFKLFQLVSKLLGINIKEKDARITLKSSKYPVLFIHGTNDPIVPSYMSEECYEACTSEKEIILFEGIGHTLCGILEKEKYQEKVLGFIDKYLNK